MTSLAEGIQHLQARRQVEFYLESKGRTRTKSNYFQFPNAFILEHKLGAGSRNFFGHSYDIMTDQEIIEIDDLNSHPKKTHRINDGIAEEYIKQYHPEYKFYRLLKEEIVDRRGWIQPDACSYLREHLF